MCRVVVLAWVLVSHSRPTREEQCSQDLERWGVLVLVSDDNFNAAQSTQWLALAYPPAESAPPQHSTACTPPSPGAPA